MTETRNRERKLLPSTMVRASLIAVMLVATFDLMPEKMVAQETVEVAGTVVDDGTGEPIEGATVRLADSSGSVRETITGPGGAFAFAEVAPGAYTLVVRRLGYEVLSTPLEIGPRAPPRLDVRLQPQAIPLEPLEVGVEGRPPRLAESGFYERMEEGWGTYFEPEWIEANKTGFVRLADFMSSLQNRAPLSRCPDVPVYLDRRPVGTASGWGTSRARSINPAGTYRSASGPPPTLLDELSVHDLGAAELYQPGAKMPLWAWNPRTMTCGVIVLWSNRTAATAAIPKIEVELCEPAGRPGEVAVDGVVEDGVTEVRLPAAHVFASYPNPEDPNGLERVEQVVRTDSLGRYRLCDVPAAQPLELMPAYGPHRGDPLVVVAETGTEMRLALAVTSPASITGVVVNEVTERPLEAASVTVAGTDVRATTDRNGRFSLEGLPPGTYKITALCGGFDTRVREVEISEGARLSVVLPLRSKSVARRTRCSA